MNKKVYTHILFDLDNTLLDFNRASKLAFKTTIRHLDIDYAEDHYNAYKQINKEVWQEYEKGKLSKQGIIKNRWNAIHSLLKIETDPQLTNKYYLDQLVVSLWLCWNPYKILMNGFRTCFIFLSGCLL